MSRNRLAALLAVLLLVPLGAARAANTTTFSFASDGNADGPTFQAFADSVGSATALDITGVRIDLEVDINDNGGGGIVVFPAEFIMGVITQKYQVVPVGSNYLHVWRLSSGRIDFFHDTATAFTPLLTIGFHGAMTSLSPHPDRLGETATIQSSESVDPFTVLFPQNLLQGIGVTNASVQHGEDLAFTLTNIKKTDGTGSFPKLDKDGNFVEEWSAEGSFSAAGQDAP
jgi:hypothetical protein